MGRAGRNGFLCLGLVLVLGASIAAPLGAQTTAGDGAAAGLDEILTNEQVIALVKAGLSEGTIVLKVKGTRTRFDTSARGLVQLKEAGVSDAVLAAMLSPAASTTAPASAPERAYEPGVYLKEVDQLRQIEPTLFTRAKSGSAFWTGMTYGISKTKMKAQTPGAHASLRTGDARPVFEFHFQVAGGLMFPVAGASSPEEFLLVPLTSKDDHRELVVGEMGLYSTSQGVKDQLMVGLQVEKLGPGRYQVTPKAELKPGEYCFYHQSSGAVVATGTGGKVFAFGVGASPSRRSAKN